MEALVHTTDPSSTSSVTLFQGEPGAGRHRVHIYNSSSVAPIIITIKVEEGSSGNTNILRKVSLQPQTDIKWLSTIGDDDKLIVDCQNNSTAGGVILIQTENIDNLTTQSGDNLVFGSGGTIDVNFSWQQYK